MSDFGTSALKNERGETTSAPGSDGHLLTFDKTPSLCAFGFLPGLYESFAETWAGRLGSASAT